MDWDASFFSALRAAVGPVAAAYALAAIGLNLQFGFTGLLNFGHVAFLMTGAYGAAVTVDQGGPLWLGVLVGVALTVALGLLFGLPTLRLRVEYLAIVTIAAGEVLRTIVRSGSRDSITHGVFGIPQFTGDFYDLNPFDVSARYGWSGTFDFTGRQVWLMLVAWSLVAVAAVAVALLSRSPWGRVLRAIREDEDAARALGKNVFVYKLQSLVIGGVLGGLGGLVLGLERASITPDTFLPALTFAVFAVVILGGAGSRVGPVLGACTYWFIIQFTDRFLRGAVAEGWISEDVLSNEDIGAVRFALVGLLLMLLMVFRPQGVLGKREEVLLE
jgi:branched-chain amino acid transport system permease protein